MRRLAHSAASRAGIGLSGGSASTASSPAMMSPSPVPMACMTLGVTAGSSGRLRQREPRRRHEQLLGQHDQQLLAGAEAEPR